MDSSAILDSTWTPHAATISQPLLELNLLLRARSKAPIWVPFTKQKTRCGLYKDDYQEAGGPHVEVCRRRDFDLERFEVKSLGSHALSRTKKQPCGYGGDPDVADIT